MARLERLSDLGGMITADIADGIQQDTYELEERIEAGVNKENAAFLKIMAKKGLDQPSAPDFVGAAGQDWTPLNKNYARWKTRTGRSPNFYKQSFRGGLRSSLQQIHSQKLLGNAKASVRRAEVVNAGTRQDTVKFSSGRKQRIGRTAKGRFAPLEQIEQFLPDRLTVTPYPNVPQDRPTKVFEASHYKVYQKLTNPKTAEKRPLFGPFMVWFTNNVITRRVEKEVQR